MNAPLIGIPGSLVIAVLQLAVFVLIAQWLARGSNICFRWKRVFGLAFGLCLLSLPCIAILLWRPPEELSQQQNLAIAVAFVPLAAALFFFCLRSWQQRRPTALTPPGDRPR